MRHLVVASGLLKPKAIRAKGRILVLVLSTRPFDLTVDCTPNTMIPLM